MFEQPWNMLFEYEQPPVVETVLSVKFRDMPGMTGPEIFDFWNNRLRCREERPLTEAETQPFYQMPIELFGGAGRIVGPPIQFSTGTPPARYCFTNQDRDDLVQLQRDWLAVNWRKQPGKEYTRYESGRAKFESVWKELTSHLAANKLGPLNPVQCEVTYINHIYVDTGTFIDFAHAEQVTSLLGPAGDILPAKPEGINAGFSYAVNDDEDQPFARLRIQVDSAVSTEGGRKLLVMNLTFRGRPLSADLDGVLRLFDSGHNWIVGSFDALTTQQMHSLWIRKPRKVPE
ncbi:TIGR04255 family protein [Ferrimicrobium acidiphilum]|uniref:TIGR04255 family protein n=1 Tax=Ferrimicrobium acidiphilum TaxID=121039 RepID=UPI0023F0C1C0|nr:TIGR04255 family protein [Ferrimicrobium acidiphilum]